MYKLCQSDYDVLKQIHIQMQIPIVVTVHLHVKHAKIMGLRVMLPPKDEHLDSLRLNFRVF